MKNISVKRKCLKQKVPMVSIPRIMLNALDVEEGNHLKLTLNCKSNCIEIRRAEDDKNN
jgi:antitoxin component of MazEF toxin-antitoxin module